MLFIVFILEYESWLPWQRPLKIRTSRFKSFIYSRAEPNGENRVKIRPVEVETTGLTEIVKNDNNKIQKQNLSNFRSVWNSTAATSYRSHPHRRQYALTKSAMQSSTVDVLFITLTAHLKVRSHRCDWMNWTGTSQFWISTQAVQFSSVTAMRTPRWHSFFSSYKDCVVDSSARSVCVSLFFPRRLFSVVEKLRMLIITLRRVRQTRIDCAPESTTQSL